jgi:hypothetical protein
MQELKARSQQLKAALLRFLMRLVLAAALAKLLQLKSARYGLLVLCR